jgi:polysaccharide export outer membrane protein
MSFFGHRYLSFVLVAAILMGAVAGAAQETQRPDDKTPSPAAEQSSSTNILPLNPGDLVEINTMGVPELTTKVRVNENGEIYLPLIGYLTVGGMRPTQVQELIEQRLVDGKFVNNPHVSVSTSDAMGVTIVGEVVRPGVFPITMARRFSDLLSMAQGMKPTAGRQITISHRGSTETRTIKYDPDNLAQMDFELQPGDVVSVSKAGLVYVVGEVNYPAGLAMDQEETLSLLRAIALVRGPARDAALNKTTILRKDSAGKMTTIPVKLKDLLHAKAEDVNLIAGDVVYVPSSSSMKGFMRRGAEGLMQATTQLAVISAY